MLDMKGLEEIKNGIGNPESAPKELTDRAFPVDFRHLMKGCQYEEVCAAEKPDS